MSWKNLGISILLGLAGSPLFAGPTLTVSPKGIESGNWVWEVDITPDLALVPGGTPLALELGLRLPGDPLISVTNINPLVFDTSLPARAIFGWETSYDPFGNNNPFPEGIEINCTGCSATNPATRPTGIPIHHTTVVPGTNNEIFAAMGSDIVHTPGPVPFLKIVALGPDNGGPTSSSIQWLGSHDGKAIIAQIVGTTGQNFEIEPGSATQSLVPEPTGIALLPFGAVGLCLRRSKSRQRLQ
jgi:hypothetical protein